MTLGDRLVVAAGDLPGAASTLDPDGRLVWSRAGRAFATVSGDGNEAEFCLEPSVAEAAARTPDVESSGRGPGWVRLTPSELDDGTIDRAVAWLASAYRRSKPKD